ncbi:uncharacterized protein TNCV_2061561 [Trichonephila clavipes]|nr:uncharacterized protein TNCV_2061561 [Trichonephila clavipes]
MDFAEINSRGKRGELLGRIDRQNSRFRTAKTIIIKFGMHASFVESESAKNALNEVRNLNNDNLVNVTLADANAVANFKLREITILAKRQLCNILSGDRLITKTIARLRIGHYRGMKIDRDGREEITGIVITVQIRS